LRLANTRLLRPASSRKDDGDRQMTSGKSTWRTVPPLLMIDRCTRVPARHAAARRTVGPGQGYAFGDAQASGVDDLEQHAIAPGRSGTDRQAYLDF
jgi:hypothetical protein